ncbi:type I glyceraldehyde-3-phosphate dehydrogenase [Candidatus Woesearchaeota archaeon]|nr:MAG: type I glyceraldehyde-3-phosphate dehydrogenase [Candidatus Woesearchaeota archaeon]
MPNIAINGFGRIGRVMFRVGFGKLNIVAINTPRDAKTIANLLKYDTVYGKFPGRISYTKNYLVVNGKKVRLFSEKDPLKIPWKELKVDVVAECTGKFTKKEDAMKHIKAGAKKVLLSAPSKDAEITVVMGVNHDKLKPKHKIVSNASCTTNCFAIIAKVLNDAFKIKNGYMVTVHSYTSTQRIVDGSHKDLRRARAAAQNIVPTTSGAALATEKVLPSLKGKVHASAVRVPVIDGSLCNFVCTVSKKASKEKVNQTFYNAAKRLKKFLEYSKDEIVSSDIIGNNKSAVFDSLLTEVSGNMVKVVAWYDNEMGYASRMVDVAKLMLKK